MKNIGYVLILVAVLLLSGCATIFTGTTDPVTIESTQRVVCCKECIRCYSR